MPYVITWRPWTDDVYYYSTHTSRVGNESVCWSEDPTHATRYSTLAQARKETGFLQFQMPKGTTFQAHIEEVPDEPLPALPDAAPGQPR
jgi:hypothetical protein